MASTTRSKPSIVRPPSRSRRALRGSLPEALHLDRHAQLRQHRHAVRLQHHPGSDRVRLGETLEDGDAMAIARQQQGGGKAGRARARYCNGARHQSARFPLAQRWANCLLHAME